jgi:hypothetical protein
MTSGHHAIVTTITRACLSVGNRRGQLMPVVEPKDTHHALYFAAAAVALRPD